MSVFRILRNVVSNYAAAVITSLIGFVLTPMLFHCLQPSNYAILAFSLTNTAILEALDLGMFNALVRSVSDLSTRKLYSELRSLVSTVYYVMAGLGVLGTVVLAILSPFIEDFFHLRPTASVPGYLILALVGLSVAFQVPGAALRAYLMGCQDFHLSNMVDIVSQVLRAAAMVLLLRAGFGLLPIAAVFPVTACLRFVGMLAVTRRASIPLSPCFADVNFKSLRAIRGFASLSFVEDTATRWYSQADLLLAARLLPLQDLAILTVARRIPLALTQFAQQPFWVAYPMVSAAAARADRSATKRFMLVSTRNLVALILPLAVALFIWAEVILRLWVGVEVVSGVTVFRILLFFDVFVSLQEIPLTLLYGLGRIRLSAGLSLAMLGAAIGIGAWACSRNGLWGLTIALAAIQIIGTSLLCWNALKVAELPLFPWLTKAVAPAVLVGLPAAACCLIAYRLLPHNFIGLVISFVAGLTLFVSSVGSLVTRRGSEGWQSRFKRLLLEIE